MDSLKGINVGVFVISLKNSARRKHIINEFAKVSLNFEFIDAVEGKNLSLSEDHRVNYSQVSKFPDWLTLGMIGCSLSHVLVYEKIIERRLDYALIFEDDICFNISINDIVAKVVEHISLRDVTMFFYQSFDEIVLKKTKFLPLSTECSIIESRQDQTLTSTAAYMIGREAASKMKEYLLPIHTGPDCWSDFRKLGIVDKIKLLYPMPCYNAYFQSEILHNGKLSSKIKETVGRVLNKLKIPFLEKALRQRRYRFIKSMQRIRIEE